MNNNLEMLLKELDSIIFEGITPQKMANLRKYSEGIIDDNELNNPVMKDDDYFIEYLIEWQRLNQKMSGHNR